MDPFSIAVAIAAGTVSAISAGFVASTKIGDKQERTRLKEILRSTLGDRVQTIVTHKRRHVTAFLNEPGAPMSLHLYRNVRGARTYFAILEILDLELASAWARGAQVAREDNDFFAPSQRERMAELELLHFPLHESASAFVWRLKGKDVEEHKVPLDQAVQEFIARYRGLRARMGLAAPLPCPRCDDFELSATERILGAQSCGQCHGVWLPRTTAMSLYEELGLTPGDIEARKATSTVRCPQCQHEMVALFENEVVLDACGHCGAIWLDEGEADRFLSTQ